ncbi:TetR/AcrR family transcriptional regulator [Massilia yuzhufengensis]|uniref:Transcriptional regulator, TetR family n=1 Tax=Massilia yuzhufengensis TaxID=1164594 RepID=A0A1I1UNH2_9BURK|nr:TetR/AcrR family transcriptional regulator [Massilia yuzhufengensis]SFD72115.1 transcriptional regulator, TetR family [Massilia yuzhufengensis]
MKAQLTTSSRSYRGLSQEARRADRRARLVAAAIAVYGERGYHQATVKAVCDAAGLTERYFYESFANSEALLIDSFDAVVHSVLGQITRAAQDAGRGRITRSRAMLHAYFESLQNEPQSARVFLVEIRGVSRAVDQAFDGALRAIGREVARIVAPPGVPENALLQAGVVGGVIHIALRWIEDGYRPGIDTVVDSALRLGTVLASASRRRTTPAPR